ncbi:uncharacterized protein LOC110427531 [Herrania umbratica]|uniref:Uncharacterized protein LOC110427531 n=1 Tax=Herrania umbratica TaxID=108875 RepID=A0A6J1BKG8_9ROSI|nr:uncharacterized protein LOC110427531 [Herrania umbratica]
MEATRGGEATGFLEKVLPPRLEDAGLEDCALPPDSIHEAFRKAASAVKSRAAFFHSDDEDEDEPGCLDDLFPDNAKCSSDFLASLPCPDMSDVLVVGEPSDPASDSVGGCVKEKEGGREVVEGRDAVVVGGDGVEAGDGRGCIDDELKGLEIGVKEKRKKENQEEEETGKEKPILVEGFA